MSAMPLNTKAMLHTIKVNNKADIFSLQGANFLIEQDDGIIDERKEDVKNIKSYKLIFHAHLL